MMVGVGGKRTPAASYVSIFLCYLLFSLSNLSSRGGQNEEGRRLLARN